MWEALKGEREQGVVIILYFKYKTKINDKIIQNKKQNKTAHS